MSEVAPPIRKSPLVGARYLGRYRFAPPSRWFSLAGEPVEIKGKTLGCYEVETGIYDIWDETEAAPEGASLN